MTHRNGRKPPLDDFGLESAFPPVRVITVVSSEVQDRIKRTVEVIAEELDGETARRLLDRLDEVWM